MSGPSATPPRDGPSEPPGSGARGSACVLLVDERVVLRSAAPPDAEYALFDSAEIELRSSEPGRVREHGYMTTAALARERLEHVGATVERAREVASSLQPFLARAYARGSAVEQIAKVLAPIELLASDGFDVAKRLYRGVYLDLAALAADMDRPHASAELQALYLALVLEGVPDAAKVALTTDTWTKTRRPGERTHRRPPLAGLPSLREAMLAHAENTPAPRPRDPLPRQDVLALLRTKADAAADDDERALYTSLEAVVTARTRPDKGPLADPTLWAVEERIDAGQVVGLLDQIEALERTSGRTPGTTYLRGRAALLFHLEPPKLVAERISALALSMTSFQELSLLAAEAWLEAGDPRRAMPYARDLVDAPGIDEGLLIRAQRVLARIVGAAPARGSTKTIADSIPAPMPPSRPPPAPPLSASPRKKAPSTRPPSLAPKAPSTRPPSLVPPSTPPLPTADDAVTPKAPPSRRRQTAKLTPPPLGEVRAPRAPVDLLPPTSPSARPNQRPGSAPAFGGTRPPELDLDLPPAPAASFTVDLPGEPPREEPRRASGPPSRPSRRRITGVRIETVSPKSVDPRAEPDDPPPVPAMPAPRAPRVDSGSFAAVGLRPARSASHAPFASPARGTFVLHGAELPAYEVEVPPPVLPRAPLLSPGAADERLEELSLPPGAGSIPTSGRPTSPLEARVWMVLLARELGREYRERRGVILRTDLEGLEAMQAHLFERFPDHVLRAPEDLRELQRHGAAYSEILSRRLDAEWVDVTPREEGHWAMIVPPDLRVWPFGRIARLVANGHRERDLVSTFLELSARARPRGGAR